MKRVPVVSIIGRTNVGKSSLFNAIVGRRVAVVEDFPGVTRDRSYATINTESGVYKICDTGGYVGEDENPLNSSVREQVKIAVAESSLVVVVFDGIEGPSPLDNEVVQFIRSSRKPALFIANKCEKPVHAQCSSEFYSLGIDNITPISAAHGEGVKEVKRIIIRELKDKNLLAPLQDIEELESEVEDEFAKEKEDRPIKVALIGKPNVGKSTLLNKLLGENRAVTSPIAGTTRDTVDVELVRDGQKYVFVDTAGLRRKAKVDNKDIERFGNLRSLRALSQCDVAVLVLDGSGDLGSLQDARLAGLAHDRGRGIVVVVNKWDIVEKDNKTAKAFKDYLKEHFKFARYAPVVFLSALTGRRCPSLITEINEVFKASRIRVPTSEVNKVITVATAKKQPTRYRGQPIKYYFATQIGVMPPTFVIFVDHPKKIQFGYERYIKNQIRKAFGFYGVDIKIVYKKRRQKALDGSNAA